MFVRDSVRNSLRVSLSTIEANYLYRLKMHHIAVLGRVGSAVNPVGYPSVPPAVTSGRPHCGLLSIKAPNSKCRLVTLEPSTCCSMRPSSGDSSSVRCLREQVPLPRSLIFDGSVRPGNMRANSAAYSSGVDAVLFSLQPGFSPAIVCATCGGLPHSI